VSANFAEGSPLGRHRKPSRLQLPQGATAAAAPTLAAALCLSPQAAPVAYAATAHTAVLDAVSQLAGSPNATSAPATSARQSASPTARPTTASAAARGSAGALPATYRVRHGDSLSAIARRLYHDRADWPALYWRNHRRIHWADDIYAGQVLHVPAKPAHVPAAPAALQPLPAPQAPRAAAVPPQVTAGPAAGSVTTAAPTATPGGAFGACVIARESGGNPQIMNATGHYGLYQFSESTWIAYGGSAADFGHASVAEQNRVFANALAAGGESNWAPYDGC
jgi:LysM repeat protein